jgi:hypothetical protein
VPTQPCLLFADGAQEIGVDTVDDLTDVLQFCLPLLCGVYERISRRQIAVIQRAPLSYRLGSVPAYLATNLFYSIYLHLTTSMLD